MARQYAWRIGTLLVLILTAVWPRDARACGCGLGDVYVEEFPQTGASAPINVQPRFLLEMTFPRSLHERDAVVAYYAASTLVCGSSGKPEARDGVVRVRARIAQGHGDIALVTLIPDKPLAPGSTCAVVGPEGVGPEGPTDVLTWFRVDEREDRSAPVQSGVVGELRSGTFAPAACETGTGEGWLELGGVRDDTTERGSLLVAVWVREDGGAIDYDTAPTTWLAPYDLGDRPWKLRIFGGSVCSPHGNFPMPRMGVEARVGVRLVDLAGLMSSPSEVRVAGVRNRWQVIQVGDDKTPAVAVALAAPLLVLERPALPAWKQPRYVIAFVLTLVAALVVAFAAAAWASGRRRG